MIQTEYGSFTGDSWQRVCKICFIQKYDHTHYLEVVASPGDFGLEGFTKSGKAFQCYCPDREYSPSELYEKQRDKINTDLNKLKTYEIELSKRLGETKIKVWYFVTPEYRKNEILAYCVSKTVAIKSWNLSIIDNDNFQVIPMDIDFLHPYLKIALDSSNHKLAIEPKKETTTDEIINYKSSEDYLSQNAFEKHKKRLTIMENDIETEINKSTHKTIKHFLKGDEIIKLWKDITPNDYQKFMKIIRQEEEDIEDICNSPSDDNNKLYVEIKDKIQNKIADNFTNLEGTMVKDLANYVIADWILRCPLNFTRKNVNWPN